MKVLFHENQLSYRGTSVALFDYAYYNEKLLGNESVIVYNRTNPNTNSFALQRFMQHFKVVSYDDISELDTIIKSIEPDVFYAIKSGENDLINTNLCKMCVHTVFKVYEPHGDVYAYVSEWLANHMHKGSQFVPHMINIPDSDESLHEELNIPRNAKVFGYYGGKDSFDIKFVQRTVKQLASLDGNCYFIFMGVDDFTIPKYFWQRKKEYKNIKFLPANSDLLFKVKFINTCDAMLHARMRGETFGIAIGEFAMKDVPIITYSESAEKAHIDILGDHAYYYHDKKSLIKIITSSLTVSAKVKYVEFSPEKVMRKFEQVFLK